MPANTKTRKAVLNRKLIEKLLQQHEDVLKEFTVKRIGLFGSFARNQQRDRSDIDFLVEFKKPTFDNFMDLIAYLEKLLHRRVDLITNGNLSPRIKPFVENEVRWHEIR